MYKILWNASVLATGAAGAVVSFHQYQSYYQRSVFAESVENNNDLPSNPNSSDLDLELKHVQVFFRHGARTPLNVLEGFSQACYDKDLLMRPHSMTLFPHERISIHTGLPCDWAPYEYSLRRKNLLSGEAIPGHLTGYGQEQMYGLGLKIREAYGDQLGLRTFDPSVFYVLSTNITRTVESARCVIAGIYGHEQLRNYASENGPIKIGIAEKPINILIPDTQACSILRQVNHASLLHFDFVSSMKTDREVVEKHIDEIHDSELDALTKVQDRINKILESKQRTEGSSSNDGKATSTSSTIAFNSDRQPYNHDGQLHDIMRERNLLIGEVSHFWHNAISHHPAIGKQFPKEEMKALLHLRQIEVEEFQLKFKSGYRFKFYFDSNPYFHNRVVYKEVHRQADGTLMSTDGTKIKWKTGKELGVKNKLTTDQEGKDKEGDGMSFFSWLSEQNLQDSDSIGDSLHELWKNPLNSYKHISYKMDHSTTKKINFVFLYDDMTARVTHGWWYPKELQQFRKMTEKNGARMMFYAMTGRHKRERPVVTSLSTGRLLKDMVDRAEGFMKGENPQRICLYSSHDSTLVALLESLGLWQHVWPPFGSDVRLEVYQDKKSSEFYVKVLYQGQAVKLRGQTDDLIRWEEFRRVVEPYAIDQKKFEEICESNFLAEVAEDVLQHEEGEATEGKESKRISETPAGM